MKLLLNLLKRRDIWRRLLLERATEPLHLNLLSVLVAVFGTTRAKILFDLLIRQQHAYGLLNAAESARVAGLREVTVVEMGVGSGVGLLNICEIARRITRVTGIRFRVVGFDTGAGMPPPRDYRDHPELYQEGWFPLRTEDVRKQLPDFAEIVLGNVATTVPNFAANLSPSAPLAFATLDVDYYSSSVDALKLFLGPAEGYLPVLPVYVDDVALETHNPACGEQLAIREFNETQKHRAIWFDAFLVHRRVFKHAEWLSHMYNLHVFDHPRRSTLNRNETVVVVNNPYLVKG